MLFIAIFKKNLIIRKRYLINSIIGIAIMLFLFLLIFLGYSSLAPNLLTTDSTTSLVVGYVAWVLALSAFQTVTELISDEIKQGTLPSLYLSKYSFSTILISSILSGFVTDIIMFALMLFLSSAISGITISVNYIVILPLLIAFCLPFWGIGLITSGLTMLAKRTDALIQLLSFLFMGLLLLPKDSLVSIIAIPGGSGLFYLNKMIATESYSFLDFRIWINLFLPGLIYFAIGLVIFRVCEKIAVKNGTLGNY